LCQGEIFFSALLFSAHQNFSHAGVSIFSLHWHVHASSQFEALYLVHFMFGNTLTKENEDYDSLLIDLGVMNLVFILHSKNNC
jgi:hypothetical protein